MPYVRVLDETTSVEIHRWMALDAMIDRTTLEYSTACEALERFRRYWYFDETANNGAGVMYYLRAAVLDEPRPERVRFARPSGAGCRTSDDCPHWDYDD